jgi:hypothetical protein
MKKFTIKLPILILIILCSLESFAISTHVDYIFKNNIPPDSEGVKKGVIINYAAIEKSDDGNQWSGTLKLGVDGGADIQKVSTKCSNNLFNPWSLLKGIFNDFKGMMPLPDIIAPIEHTFDNLEVGTSIIFQVLLPVKQSDGNIKYEYNKDVFGKFPFEVLVNNPFVGYPNIMGEGLGEWSKPEVQYFLQHSTCIRDGGHWYGESYYHVDININQAYPDNHFVKGYKNIFTRNLHFDNENYDIRHVIDITGANYYDGKWSYGQGNSKRTWWIHDDSVDKIGFSEYSPYKDKDPHVAKLVLNTTFKSDKETFNKQFVIYDMKDSGMDPLAHKINKTDSVEVKFKYVHEPPEISFYMGTNKEAVNRNAKKEKRKKTEKDIEKQLLNLSNK